VELLVEQGADVNMQLQGGKYGSALAAAAACLGQTKAIRVVEVVGAVEIMELLIEQGADVNMQLQGGEYGSALAAAAHHGQTEIVELLIKQGADVNMQLRGAYGSALEAAVSSGRIEIVKFLLEQGAEVNLPLRGGRYEVRCQCLRGGCDDGVTNLVLVHATLGADRDH
jgi:ankyrin repeat protein